MPGLVRHAAAPGALTGWRLALLVGAQAGVYTTRLVRLQIEQSGLLEPISEFRIRFGVGQADLTLTWESRSSSLCAAR